jgi:hypothetical protein
MVIFLPNKIKDGKMGRECSRNGEMSNKKLWLESLKGSRRPRHTQDDDIKMDLRKVRWEVVDWIHLAQDRDWWQAVVNMVMNLQVP